MYIVRTTLSREDAFHVIVGVHGQICTFGKPGGGHSAVIASNGRVITKNLGPMEEGIIYAEIDHDLIALDKSFVDLIGHYSRPDLFTLVVDDWVKRHVVYHEDKSMNGENVRKDKVRAGVVKKVEQD
jgi:hypothetical protein